MQTSFLNLFCSVDDFCQSFQSKWEKSLLESGERKRKKNKNLSLSEILTIIVYFHTSNFRTFKHYYRYLEKYHKKEFPNLVSYNWFVRLKSQSLLQLCVYLSNRKGEMTGVSFIDSTPIMVCHSKRISNNKVFKGLAKLGKSTKGWFFGFKLHLVVNELGELLGFTFTPGNVDDRVPVPRLTKNVFGKIYGDKGYISKKLFSELFENGLHLVTSVKKNMKNSFMLLEDKILLRKRSIIETINDQLKNISQIEHTRHRSVPNFMVNLVAALISYSHQEKKPAISLQDQTAIKVS